MPLGEKLWEETSRTTGVRIMNVSDQGIQEEVRYAGEIKGFGRLADQPGRTLGTNEYFGKLSEGIMSGTVNGTMVLGSETVSFQASGLARMVKRSPLSAAQSLALIRFVETPPSLRWLTQMLILWEGSVDPKDGVAHATAYEWIE